MRSGCACSCNATWDSRLTGRDTEIVLILPTPSAYRVNSTFYNETFAPSGKLITSQSDNPKGSNFVDFATKMSSNNSKTVCFNVGGTKYEVAKSTIEKYPGTMLARLITETWEGKDEKKRARGEDEQDDIFIDADGLQFRFVLEYMRHQKVDLPMGISTKSVLHNLKYFGFDNVDPDSVTLKSANMEAARHLILCDKERIQKKEELAWIVDFSEIAHEVFKLFAHSGGLLKFKVRIIREYTPTAYFSTAPMSKGCRDVLQKCLSEYGLCYKNHDQAYVYLELLDSKSKNEGPGQV